jgi:hypothetical protein
MKEAWSGHKQSLEGCWWWHGWLEVLEDSAFFISSLVVVVQVECSGWWLVMGRPGSGAVMGWQRGLWV